MALAETAFSPGRPLFGAAPPPCAAGFHAESTPARAMARNRCPPQRPGWPCPASAPREPCPTAGGGQRRKGEVDLAGERIGPSVDLEGIGCRGAAEIADKRELLAQQEVHGQRREQRLDVHPHSARRMRPERHGRQQAGNPTRIRPGPGGAGRRIHTEAAAPPNAPTCGKECCPAALPTPTCPEPFPRVAPGTPLHSTAAPKPVFSAALPRGGCRAPSCRPAPGRPPVDMRVSSVRGEARTRGGTGQRPAGPASSSSPATR